MYYIKAQEYGMLSWTVSDLSGKLLKKQVQQENFNVIDITDLPNGIYLFRAITSDTEYNEKLIKK